LDFGEPKYVETIEETYYCPYCDYEIARSEEEVKKFFRGDVDG